MYNLKQRTKTFSITIIRLVQSIPHDDISEPLINQLIRSGTGIGANYYEADNAESGNDFKHKIAISRKEAQETIYWLELITELFQNKTTVIEPVHQEAIELNLILSSIYNKVKPKEH